MKFLLVLLLACQTAAEHAIFGRGGVIGNGKIEIKVSGSWGYASGVLTISSNEGKNIESVSKGTAAGVLKGGDDGTGASGGDAKGHVEGGTSGDAGGTIKGENEREKEGSAGTADTAGKGGDAGAFEGNATEVIQGEKDGNAAEKDHDETGEKLGDDRGTRVMKRSEREAATTGGDSEGVEDESAKGKGGDIGGGHKVFYEDEADPSETDDDFSESPDEEGDESYAIDTGRDFNHILVNGGEPRSRNDSSVRMGKPYKGIIIDGITYWIHIEDDGIIKRGNWRDKHGVLGGFLPSIPSYVSKISSSGRLQGFNDKRFHLTDKETGQKFLSVLQPSGEIKEDLFKYLIKCFKQLNLFEVVEVFKYRIQRDRVLAIFASYLESDFYTNHRLELREEPSVEEFLNETTGPSDIPVRNVFYDKLRMFIRRLFCSCPSKTIDPRGYPTRSVTTLLIKLPISEVARVMEAAVMTKPEFYDFAMVLEHLLEWSSINKLDAIRASVKYNQMRKYLSSRVNVGILDKILNSFFGFDLALIFSVYTMI